jgi:hypothetical protein
MLVLEVWRVWTRMKEGGGDRVADGLGSGGTRMVKRVTGSCVKRRLLDSWDTPTKE